MSALLRSGKLPGVRFAGSVARRGCGFDVRGEGLVGVAGTASDRAGFGGRLAGGAAVAGEATGE